MKLKHRNMLEFQKRLISVAPQLPRIDALNIFDIVRKNLDEFVALRIPKEDPADIPEAMEELGFLYQLWGNAVYQKFPNLCAFSDIIENAETKYPEYSVVGYADIRPQNIIMVDDETFIDELKSSLAKKEKPVVIVEHRYTDHLDKGTPMHPIFIQSDPYGGNIKAQFHYKFLWNSRLLSSGKIADLPENPDTRLTGKSDMQRHYANRDRDLKLSASVLEKDELRHYVLAATAPMFIDEEWFASHAYDEKYKRWPNIILRTPLTWANPVTDATEKITFLDVLNELGVDVFGQPEGATHRPTEIWMTIYRTDKWIDPGKTYHGPFWDFIAQASQLRQNFHVFIETRARTDEENNMNLYQYLSTKHCDVHVVPKNAKHFDKKVHGKVLIMKCEPIQGEAKDEDLNRWIQVVSTGNFNTSAQKNYRDTVLITQCMTYPTSKFEDLYPETHQFFEAIFGLTKNVNVSNQLIWQPKGLLGAILTAIDMAASYKRTHPDEHAVLWIKVNNISDGEVMQHIMDAVRAGVDTRIIVRTSCQLPKVVHYPNMRITSVCGRYLEHDRFLVTGVMDPAFDAPNAHDQYFLFQQIFHCYMMTADLMPRNLRKRFEIMYDVFGDECESICNMLWSMMNHSSDPYEGFFNVPINVDESDLLDDTCYVPQDADKMFPKYQQSGSELVAYYEHLFSRS